MQLLQDLFNFTVYEDNLFTSRTLSTFENPNYTKSHDDIVKAFSYSNSRCLIILNTFAEIQVPLQRKIDWTYPPDYIYSLVNAFLENFKNELVAIHWRYDQNDLGKPS